MGQESRAWLKVSEALVHFLYGDTSSVAFLISRVIWILYYTPKVSAGAIVEHWGAHRPAPKPRGFRFGSAASFVPPRRRRSGSRRRRRSGGDGGANRVGLSPRPDGPWIRCQDRGSLDDISKVYIENEEGTYYYTNSR